MTQNEFRKQALTFPGAIESAHMNHPDFRLNGRIFATLDYPDTGWGMVKLAPEISVSSSESRQRCFNRATALGDEVAPRRFILDRRPGVC